MAATTYAPISGVASDNLFDPTNASNFYNNFNNMSVLYQPAPAAGGVNADAQRYNDLVAAYEYASDPANKATLDSQNYAGYTDYILSQLVPDIQEEQNLNTYNTSQQSFNQLGQQLSGVNSDLTQVSNGDPNGADTSDWGYIKQYANQLLQLYNTDQGFQQAMQKIGLKNAGQLQTYINNAPTSVNPFINRGQLTQAVQLAQQQIQSQYSQAQLAQNTQKGNVLNGFILPGQDYANQENQVANYYNDPTTGQVALATQNADQDLYQMAYNLKNQINQQANFAGVNNSGERQKAIGDANSKAINQSTQLFNDANNQATAAINANKQANQQNQAQQQNLTNTVKEGNINDLFNTATQGNIGAYNTNLNQSNQTGTQNAEKNIAQEQANSALWGTIFNTAGQGLGAAAATATGGLI